MQPVPPHAVNQQDAPLPTPGAPYPYQPYPVPQVPEHLAADYSAGFVTAVRRTLARPLRFRGLASRREFWFSYLAWMGFVIGVMAGFGVLAAWVETWAQDPVWASTAVGICALTTIGVVALVYMLPVTIRRLHDGGRSAWWLLLSLVPYGGIVVVVFLALEPRPWLWRPRWIGRPQPGPADFTGRQA